MTPESGSSSGGRDLTVAEAKARLLEHGERSSRELDAAVTRWGSQIRAELRRSAVWLPLSVLGLGAALGGRARSRRRRQRSDDAADAGPAAGRAGWVRRLAPVVIDIIGRAVANRSDSRR